MTQHQDSGPVIVRVDRRGAHGHVVTVSINHPARLNSLSSGVIAAFIEAVREVGGRSRSALPDRHRRG